MCSGENHSLAMGLKDNKIFQIYSWGMNKFG